MITVIDAVLLAAPICKHCRQRKCAAQHHSERSLRSCTACAATLAVGCDISAVEFFFDFFKCSHNSSLPASPMMFFSDAFAL